MTVPGELGKRRHVNSKRGTRGDRNLRKEMEKASTRDREENNGKTETISPNKRNKSKEREGTKVQTVTPGQKTPRGRAQWRSQETRTATQGIDGHHAGTHEHERDLGVANNRSLGLAGKTRGCCLPQRQTMVPLQCRATVISPWGVVFSALQYCCWLPCCWCQVSFRDAKEHASKVWGKMEKVKRHCVVSGPERLKPRPRLRCRWRVFLRRRDGSLSTLMLHGTTSGVPSLLSVQSASSKRQLQLVPAVVAVVPGQVSWKRQKRSSLGKAFSFSSKGWWVSQTQVGEGRIAGSPGTGGWFGRTW